MWKIFLVPWVVSLSFLIIKHRIKRGELHPPHGKSFEFMRGWVPKQENY